MNLLTVIVMLFLILFGLYGYQKGFVRLLASLTSFLLVAFLVYHINPYITDFLKENTPVYEVVTEKCQQLVSGGTGEAPTSNVENQTEGDQDLESIFKEIGLPAVLAQGLSESDAMGDIVDNGVESIRAVVVTYLADLFLSIISFVGTSIVVYILLRVTMLVLGILTHLPIIHGINQIFGLVLGLSEGMIILWMGFLLITVFASSHTGAQLMRMIEESPVLLWLYDTNIALKLLIGA